MRTALVTGGAGFIGSHLVDALIMNDWRVVVIDNLSVGKRQYVDARATLHVLDIRDAGIGDVFQESKPDVVFHLAAQKSVHASHSDPMTDATANILGTINVLQCCVRCNVKRFIHSSTGGAIYGETSQIPTPEGAREMPLSPYGLSKLAADSYASYYRRHHGLASVSLRYANVYGPRQDPSGEAGVVAVFLSELLSGEEPVVNGSGEQTRDFVYVSDIVGANLASLDEKASGVYNVGTGIETSVNGLYQHIAHCGRFSKRPHHGPSLEGEIQRSCLSSKKIHRELGWKPAVDLREGIEKTLHWFQSNTQKA